MGLHLGAGQCEKPRFGRSLTLPAQRFPGIGLPYDVYPPINGLSERIAARLPLESKMREVPGNLSVRDLMG
jgi:hypothetical protein